MKSIPGSYDNVKFELDFSTPEVGEHCLSIAERFINGVKPVRVTGDTDRWPDKVYADTGKLLVHNIEGET